MGLLAWAFASVALGDIAGHVIGVVVFFAMLVWMFRAEGA